MALRGRDKLAASSSDMFLGYTPIRSLVEAESGEAWQVGGRVSASLCDRGKWKTCGLHAVCGRGWSRTRPLLEYCTPHGDTSCWLPWEYLTGVEIISKCNRTADILFCSVAECKGQSVKGKVQTDMITHLLVNS